MAAAARALVAVRQESRWPSGVKATHAGSWRSGRTPPTSTTGTGEGQRAGQAAGGPGPAGGAGPGASAGTKLRPGAALRGHEGRSSPRHGVRGPGPLHTPPPASVSLFGGPGGGAEGCAQRRVPGARERNALAHAHACARRERGRASHTWPEESGRPAPPWTVSGDRRVRLEAGALELLSCGLRVSFRVSRRGPLPESRGQRFGACSAGAESSGMLRMPRPLTRNCSLGLCCNSRGCPWLPGSRGFIMQPKAYSPL